MMKVNSSGNFFTMASTFLRCCLVVVAVEPICHTSAEPITTAVMSNFTLGDSPVWYGELQSLVFVDTYESKLIRYQPGSPVALSVVLDTGSDLAFLVPVKSNVTKFAVGYADGVSLFAWDGTSSKDKPALKAQKFLSIVENNFHEGEGLICGKVDVSGRLWVGSSYANENGTLKGRIYSVDKSGKVIKKLNNIAVPYGLAWNLDNTQLFYADTDMNSIVAISYEKDTGNLIGEGRDIFKLASQNITPPSIPYGMTIDTDGNVWLAVWHEAIVLKIDPTNGTVLMKVDIPENTDISSVTFGGSNLEDMYVTTRGTLQHVTGTGSKGIGVYQLEEQWPKNGPPPP